VDFLNSYIFVYVEFLKNRYFIFLSFKGTSYHGWQIQPNSVTVQKMIEEALSVVLEEMISVIGAGRTDTGVHASFFCAHFDSSHSDLDTNQKILFRLNSFLPKDIAANSIRKVLPDANARYSAISRTYKYYISRAKDPFSDSYSWFLQGDISIQKMNEASIILHNHSDFTSFSKLHSGAKTNICRIYEASWDVTDSKIIFTIKADRFLRNMVRSIVGTIVDIGRGKTDIKGFEEIINSRDRCRAGKSAPAKGLFLVDIEYPDEIYI